MDYWSSVAQSTAFEILTIWNVGKCVENDNAFICIFNNPTVISKYSNCRRKRRSKWKSVNHKIKNLIFAHIFYWCRLRIITDDYSNNRFFNWHIFQGKRYSISLSQVSTLGFAFSVRTSQEQVWVSDLWHFQRCPIQKFLLHLATWASTDFFPRGGGHTFCLINIIKDTIILKNNIYFWPAMGGGGARAPSGSPCLPIKSFPVQDLHTPFRFSDHWNSSRNLRCHCCVKLALGWAGANLQLALCYG